MPTNAAGMQASNASAPTDAAISSALKGKRTPTFVPPANCNNILTAAFIKAPMFSAATQATVLR